MTSMDMSSEEPSPGRPSLRLIVGLGNPGTQYVGTRHNVGFEVIEELSRRWAASTPALECNALVAEAEGALLVRPQTFMNRSGLALRCLLERRGETEADALVVYDEVHLPLGKLRLRPRGGPGGHRGMESIIESLRTQEVPRLRCGVGPEDGEIAGEELAQFVLGAYDDEETATAKEMVLRAAGACEAWLRQGVAEAMNQYNG